jgi:hypothetical protein
MCGMSIASVKQSLMNGVAVVHRISCTAIEPRHGRGGTARQAHKRAHAGAEPPNPRQFFRQTLEANYGLQDRDQKYWDTWNSLRMGPNQSITEYNVDFQQALTDLARHVTDEQVKIEKYRAGLQHDLRQLCITSPAGTRWARLNDLVQYASLQWPLVQQRIAKSKKSSSESTKVGGKRKASGSGAGGSGRSASKPKLGASGKLSDEQFQKDMAEKLCHKCHKPGHQAKNCPPSKKGRLQLLEVLALKTICLRKGIFKGSRCRNASAWRSC